MSAKAQKQVELFQDFSTAKPGNALFCHQEFLEKLEANRNSPVGKRAALLLHRLLVDERRQYYKSTEGVNRGWRRSRLGGNSGSHFYAWWAPRGAPPLKDIADFEGAPAGSIFLRDIRHHDDHAPVQPHSLNGSYLPIGAKDLRQEEYVPAPWTPTQSRFAGARQLIRIIKGYPGSGKTTALWHAADLSGAGSILYVTYSPSLASLARDHFDKFAPAHKRFHVATFCQFMREFLPGSSAYEPELEARARFQREVAGLSPRILGPWVSSKGPLYDEMHAHLIGSALPVAAGRFPACSSPRLGTRAYRDLRERFIGRGGAEAALEVLQTLEKRDAASPGLRFFPELALAWSAVQHIRAGGAADLAARGLLGFDCIALDEAQDLTPIEALAWIQFVTAVQKHRGHPVSVLIAGDEAQTVRPTDFEWGWFQDLLHHHIGSPAEFKLSANLRSPRRIATLVNRVWDLYSHISKQERPGGFGPADIEEDSSDHVVFCAATPGEHLDQLLSALSEREGLAIISLDEEIPAYVPQPLRSRVLTVFEAKGLDFHSVCVLDPGRYLQKVISATDRFYRDADLQDVTKRVAIDQLRVALSRPAERLYWLDVNPSENASLQSSRFLATGEPELEVFPVIPAVVLKSLQEDLLDTEERVRLCESDARQYLGVKPEMAWSRAQQAVALLGEEGRRRAIADEAVRRSAHLTLAEVAFCLAFRNVRLSSELGRPDLFGESARHAALAGGKGLAEIIRGIGALERASEASRGPLLVQAAAAIVRHKQELESWLAVEISSKTGAWLSALEDMLPDGLLVHALNSLLPPLYDLFAVADAPQRTARLKQRAIGTLMTAGDYQAALEIMQAIPDADPALKAACYEGAGDFRSAAEQHLQAGKLKDALRNYRSIPDFEKALELIESIPEHPAAESLEWVKRMQDLVTQRPANFGKVMLPQEKMLLEQILEAGLGVSRRKKAPTTKKSSAGRKRTR